MSLGRRPLHTYGISALAATALLGWIQPSDSWSAENVFLTGTGTVVHQASPNSNYSQLVTEGRVTANRLKLDTEDPSPNQVHAMLQFNTVFNNAGGPIPLGADIHYASLRVFTTNTSAQGGRFHRMLQPWSTSSTWNSMVNGIQTNDIEAVSGAVVNTGAMSTVDSPRTFNVQGSLQSWSGGATNHGWGMLPNGSDGWEITHFTSSTVNNRPQMKVVYSPQVPGAIDVSFQQGANGYFGTQDTRIRGAAPDDNSFGNHAELSIDGEDSGQPTQSLLKFESLFSHEGGSIPTGATIVSAWLDLNHVDQGHGADVHRMLSSWSESSTWNSLGGGVQADGSEAVAAAEAHLDGTYYNPTGDASNLITGRVIFDVTASVQAWADGNTNEGWALLPFNTDGWRFSSSEGTVAPRRPSARSRSCRPTRSPSPRRPSATRPSTSTWRRRQ
jgi:hypothetical protein